MLRVLIADDHEIVRKGLCAVLTSTLRSVSVDEAGDGAEALAKAAKTAYDLILVDITMPGRGGLDVIKELRTIRPRVPALVLSVHPEEQFAVRALRAGARGYLTKESAAEELVAAIRKVLAGGRYISASLAEALSCELDRDAGKAPHETLSDREYQVMRMIASGKPVGAIADELSLSVKTVSTHRVNILEKMRMKNNAEITSYAIRNRLAD